MSQKEYIFVDCETGVFEKKCTGGEGKPCGEYCNTLVRGSVIELR